MRDRERRRCCRNTVFRLVIVVEHNSDRMILSLSIRQTGRRVIQLGEIVTLGLIQALALIAVVDYPLCICSGLNALFKLGLYLREFPHVGFTVISGVVRTVIRTVYINTLRIVNLTVGNISRNIDICIGRLHGKAVKVKIAADIDIYISAITLQSTALKIKISADDYLTSFVKLQNTLADSAYKITVYLPFYWVFEL